MHRKIITYLITIVFFSESTAINYPFSAVHIEDYALRPPCVIQSNIEEISGSCKASSAGRKKEILTILRENDWRIREVAGVIGIKRSEEIYDFFERNGLTKELKAVLGGLLKKHGWKIYLAAGDLKLDVPTAKRLIESCKLKRPHRPKEEVLAFLRGNNWKIGRARKILGMKANENYYDAFERHGLLKHLEEKLIKRLETHHWVIARVAQDFEVSATVITRLIAKFELKRPPATKEIALAILDSYEWILGDAMGELGIVKGTGYLSFYNFFRKYGLVRRLKQELIKKLIKHNWNIKATADELKIYVETLRQLIKDCRIKKIHYDKPKTELLKILKKHQWKIGQAKKGLGIRRGQSYYDFFKEHRLLRELKAIVTKSLVKHNWNISGVGRDLSLYRRQILEFIDRLGIKKPAKTREELIRILDRFDWNIAKAHNAIGMGRYEDYYSFFKRNRLLGRLKKELARKLKKHNWSKTAVCEELGIADSTLNRLIDKLKIRVTGITKKVLLELLEKCKWNMRRLNKRLNRTKPYSYYEFFKRYGCLKELKTKLIEKLTARRWNIMATAADIGMSQSSVNKFIKQLKIKKPTKSARAILAILDKYGWNLGRAADKLGFHSRTNYYDFFKQHSLLEALDAKLLKMYDENDWNARVVAKKLGIGDRTLKNIMDKLGHGALLAQKIYEKIKVRIRTSQDLLDILKEEGLLAIASVFQHQPEELLGIMASLLPEGRMSLDELKRFMRGLGKLNLEEVAAPRGAKEFDRAQVILNTLIQKSVILSTLSEIEQEMLIKVFLRYSYKKFSKDPRGELSKFNKDKRLRHTKNLFLVRLKERVNEEFTKAMRSRYPHIQAELAPHELIGAYRLRQNDHFALLDGTRVGKTRMALAGLNPEHRTVVVSPASVIDTWLEEEGICLSSELDYDYLSMEGDINERREVLEKARKGEGYQVIILRGTPGEKQALIEAIQGKKKCIIHLSMETLREMTDEQIGSLTEALDTVIVDEWQYVDHYFAEGSPGALQATAIQKINPSRKWLLSASPYRNRPYQLYSFFHYLYKDLPDCPEWAKEGNARVFKKTFTEDMTGLRLLNGVLAKISLRRCPEEVWDLYNPDLPAEQQPYAIPRLNEREVREVGGYTITEEMAEAALKMILNFRNFIADIYNPTVPVYKRLGWGNINIIRKLNFLRWLMVSCDAMPIGIEEDSPFWDTLKDIVKERTKAGKKIILYAQNIFMVEKLLALFKDYGCVRIDGQVQGWARDEKGRIIRGSFGKKDKRFYPGKGTTPITAKSWMRHRFQWDDSINICVANIKAGVGLDLSRADVEIYTQLAQTYVEVYHSMSRAFGVNRQHIRESVEVIYMVGKYPKSIINKYKASKYARYLRSGTIDEIQLKRLKAHQTLFNIIMENIDMSAFDEQGLGLLPRIPGFLEDPSLEIEGLRPRIRQAAEAIMSLGALCAIATPTQRSAIGLLMRDAYDTKTDLRPLGDAISTIEDFKLDDLIVISEISQLESLKHKKVLYAKIPELLNDLYKRGGSLTEVYSIWNGSIPGYLILSWLGAVAPDGEPSMQTLVGELIEECRIAQYYKTYLFQRLSEALITLGHENMGLIENQRRALERKRDTSLRARIELIKRVSEIARFSETRKRLERILKDECKSFEELQEKVKSVYLDSLAKVIKRDLHIAVTRESLQELEERWGGLDSIFLFIACLKKGRRQAIAKKDKRLKAIYERDLLRFGEILQHIIKDDYSKWRNRQEGKRLFGAGVGYLRNKEKFWKEWTKDMSVKLGDVKVEPDAFLKQAHQAVAKVVHQVAETEGSQAFSNLVTAEGSWVAEKVRRFILSQDKEPLFGDYREQGRQLGSIYNRMIKGEVLTKQESKLLQKQYGIDSKMAYPDIMDAIHDRFEEYLRLKEWCELIFWYEDPSPDELSRTRWQLQKLISRLNVLLEDVDFIAEQLKKAFSLIGTCKKGEKVYKDTEVIITSDPQSILRRGMLDAQLHNRFHLEGEPEFVRKLIDDLASRNKMLVIVKSRSRVVSVAMAEIRRTSKYEPVIFLEDISSRTGPEIGHYNFETEMLTALNKKVSRVSPRPVCISAERRSDLKTITLYPSGGYGGEKNPGFTQGQKTAHDSLRAEFDICTAIDGAA